jgi:hypothetical protein
MHCETDYFDYETLVKKFVHRFRMTNIRDMFVLPVDCIVGSLLVVNDILDEGETSNERFIAVLPRHKQSGFFKNYMHSADQRFEIDFGAVIEGDDDFSDPGSVQDESEDEETNGIPSDKIEDVIIGMHEDNI